MVNGAREWLTPHSACRCPLLGRRPRARSQASGRRWAQRPWHSIHSAGPRARAAARVVPEGATAPRRRRRNAARNVPPMSRSARASRAACGAQAFGALGRGRTSVSETGRKKIWSGGASCAGACARRLRGSRWVGKPLRQNAVLRAVARAVTAPDAGGRDLLALLEGVGGGDGEDRARRVERKRRDRRRVCPRRLPRRPAVTGGTSIQS